MLHKRRYTYVDVRVRMMYVDIYIYMNGTLFLSLLLIRTVSQFNQSLILCHNSKQHKNSPIWLGPKIKEI